VILWNDSGASGRGGESARPAIITNTYKSSSGRLANGIALVLFLSRGVNVVGPALGRLTGITIAAFFSFA
jgi:hypothetical protein